MAIDSDQIAGVGPLAPVFLSDGGREGCSVSVRNRGSVAIFLGDSGVTDTTGYQLDADEAIGVWLDTDDKLYAIAESGSNEVHVLRARYTP